MIRPWGWKAEWGKTILGCVLLAALSAPVGAQYCVAPGPVNVGFDLLSGSIPKNANCACTNSCMTGFRCYPPVLGGASYETRPAGCNPKTQACTVRATLEVDLPGNSQGLLTPGSGAYLDWANAASSPVGSCGYPGGDEIFVDKGNAWIEVGGFTCSTGASAAGAYTLLAQVCIAGCPQPANQRQTSTTVDLSLSQLNALFCKKPPVYGCPKDGPAGTCCLGPGGDGAGGGGGSSPAGGGPGAGGPGTGPDTFLYYLAGGVGNPSWPGTALWTPTLGRYWSHTYAERIILDPDETHIWLITRYGTFREFSDLSAGVYATAKPTDEHRKLTRTATGWRLASLDGTLEDFDSAGRWTQTVDRNGNAEMGDYSSGPLTRVTLPDGRQEDFFYNASGKLSEIRQVGVGGTVMRSWLYTWTGDDLAQITRPDGTTLEFHYDDPRFPGYMTRQDLVSTDFVHRVEVAWELDSSGNVARTWKGDVSATGPNAVEVYTFAYTNPSLPTQAMVTDPLGQTTTYAVSRDNGSSKPKITQINGDCPVCGTGPNTVLSYGDTANPLLPTQTTDGRGLVVQFAYNANGRVASRTEAAGTPLARTTTYQYGNSSFPAFATRVDVPSTAGGSATRTTTFSYNTAGDLAIRTIQGAEAGGSFSYTTTNTFNAAGQPLTVDPPGYGTADMVTITYDSNRGNLLPLTRTAPLVGTTTFGYDAFNRQTSVIDPNGVQTMSTYDSLDRSTSTTEKGATAAEDLATTYVYNTFGDLFRTVLPRGNLIEYGYDVSGRLISIERRPDASTHGDRILYTLDAFGHRTKEELQSWNASAWVTQSFTSFVYSSRCHLDKAVYPGGAVTEYAYDCDGNLSQFWDANHPKATNPTPSKTFTYDGLNRLSSLTEPWGGAGGGSAAQSFGYDIQSHLNRVTDAEGNVTTYAYGDRDLMTSQVSPASGVTTYAYNEHGELTSEIDARGVAMSRTIDALDRPTATSFPEPNANVIYTYDDPGISFSEGRLTRIVRGTSTVDYRYDRFGRLTQDGELSYGYDRNGNPISLGYPGAVTALTTYDFADRPASLIAQRPGKPDQQLVYSASYLPFGPLSSLLLGNGLTEAHAFTQRYLPSSITLGTPANLLNWTYTTDGLGNISAITDSLNSARNRTFGYQDTQYFLTRGDGPWSTRSWTYDKIGNRLSENHGGVTDTYTYQLVPPPGTGHSPILSGIQLGMGGTRSYEYDPAGNLQQITQGAASTLLTYDAASRLSALETTNPRAGVGFRYDGRDYLTLADSSALPFLEGFESGDLCGWSAALGITAPLSCPPLPAVQPTYSSEGLLHAVQRAAAPERSYIFTLTDRPVAQMDLSGTTESWKFLSVDHLGTPIAATGTSGALLWQGGFEPFGADWSGASSAGIFLRLTGQWEEATWESLSPPSLYYNVHRWYSGNLGRYTSPDPLPTFGRQAEIPYALGNPVHNSDSLGLRTSPTFPTITPGTYPQPTPPPPVCPVPAESPEPTILSEVAAPIFAFVGMFFTPSAANAPTLDDLPPLPHPPSCCEKDDPEREDKCGRQYSLDLMKCQQWFPFGESKQLNRLRRACDSQAAVRYSECLRFGFPLSPLSPHRFQY